mgnify:CR=1 FL=1
MSPFIHLLCVNREASCIHPVPETLIQPSSPTVTHFQLNSFKPKVNQIGSDLTTCVNKKTDTILMETLFPVEFHVTKVEPSY